MMVSAYFKCVATVGIAGDDESEVISNLRDLIGMIR